MYILGPSDVSEKIVLENLPASTRDMTRSREIRVMSNLSVNGSKRR